jgi:hypothetical protein
MALMMEAASTPETSANFYQITMCSNPEDGENVESHKVGLVCRKEYSCLYAVWYMLVMTV